MNIKVAVCNPSTVGCNSYLFIYDTPKRTGELFLLHCCIGEVAVRQILAIRACPLLQADQRAGLHRFFRVDDSIRLFSYASELIRLRIRELGFEM